MVTKPSRFEKKLLSLERIRKDTENKLDRSYLQNNVSELLALEAKYEKVISQISKIRSLVTVNNRFKITI